MVLKRFESLNRSQIAGEILLPAFTSVIEGMLKETSPLPKEAYGKRADELRKFVSDQSSLDDDEKELLAMLILYASTAAKNIEAAGRMEEFKAELESAYRVLADFALDMAPVEKYCREVDREIWSTDFTRRFRNTDGKRGLPKPPDAGPQARMGDGRRGVCEYSSCMKETQIYPCKNCSKSYCKDHLPAKPPQIPQVKPKTLEQKLLLEKWASEVGHMCAPFHEEAKRLLAAEDERYMKAMENLSRRLPSNKGAVSPKFMLVDMPPKKSSLSSPMKPRDEGEGLMSKLTPNVLLVAAFGLLVLALLSVAVYVALYGMGEHKAASDAGKTPVVAPPPTTTQAATTSTTTSTTIKLTIPGCFDYCRSISPELKGACMKDRNECKSFGWSYMKDGNGYCPRNVNGVETLCCCGNDTRFFRLLGAESVPTKDDPSLKAFLQ